MYYFPLKSAKLRTTQARQVPPPPQLTPPPSLVFTLTKKVTLIISPLLYKVSSVIGYSINLKETWGKLLWSIDPLPFTFGYKRTKKLAAMAKYFFNDDIP